MLFDYGVFQTNGEQKQMLLCSFRSFSQRMHIRNISKMILGTLRNTGFHPTTIPSIDAIWFVLKAEICPSMGKSHLFCSFHLFCHTLLTLSQNDITLQWSHDGRDGVSNHRRLHCLLNCCFKRRSKKNQSSASLAFVRENHRWPVNSPHKWPVTRKMTSSWRPKHYLINLRSYVFYSGYNAD